MLQRAAQQPDQLRPILGRGDGHVRHGEHVRDVEQPHMGLAVLTDQPGAVHAEDDGQFLDRDVVDDAVVGALQERRIDRHDGPDALRGQAGGERGRVRFGDAHVEEAARPFLLEDVRARPRGHRGRDRHEVGVLGGELRDRFAEHLGPLRRPRIDRFEHARHRIVRRARVILFEVRLGKREALSFFCDHVDHARALERGHELQRLDDAGDVVPRDWPEVAEPQLFEQHPGRPQILDAFLDRLRELDKALPAHEVRGLLDHRLHPLADAVGDRAGNDGSEVLVDGTDVGGDGHPIVVQDHDQIAPGVPRVVHRLVGEAAGQRAVADDGNHLEILALQVPGGRHPQRGRQARPSVAGAELIVRALAAAQEAAQAAPLAQCRELGVAAGEDLPRIALMAHVPDDAVVRRVEDVQQRDRQLDDAEARPDVTPGLGDHVDQALPHLGGEGGELLQGKPLDVFGTANGFEHRRQFGRVTM